MKKYAFGFALLLAACGGGGGAQHAALPGVVAPPSGTGVPAQSTPQPGIAPACAPLSATPRGSVTCLALVRTNIAGGNPSGYHGRSLASAQRQAMTQVAAGSTGNALGPQQLQSAYNLPSLAAGKGQTVAIVDAYSNPSVESDLETYRAQFGLPPCTSASGCLKVRNQNGNTWPLPASNPGWGLEESLDVDMVSAICPNCNIDIVLANSVNFSDLEAAENAAVALGASYISNSYGGVEGPPAADPAFDHPGVVITAATGDNSWFAGVIMPAAFSNVVAVGGTTLYPYNNGRGWLETTWSGGGSGCSQVVQRPSWQKRVGCEQSGFDGKALADIAALADPYPGVWVFDSVTGWTIVGGTSAASPIIAAAFALAGNPLHVGPGGSSIWNVGGGASLNDITLGNNGYGCTPSTICHAGAGYDGPTGWGSPNGLGAL